MKITKISHLLFICTFLFTAVPSFSEDNQLVVLSPHWEGIRKELTNAFNKERLSQNLPPVKFRFLDVGGTTNIVRFIRSGFSSKADSIGVDLFWGGSVDAHQELTKLKANAKLNLEILNSKALPEKLFGIPLYEQNSHWVGTMLNGFGIFCNLEVLRRLNLPLPSRLSDLVKPHYRSWIGAANPSNSGSAHMAYEIILQSYGWEKGWALLQGIANNVRIFSNYAAEVPQDVGNGELACGFATDSSAWQQIEIIGQENGIFIAPEDAYLLSPDPVAVLRGAPSFQLAQQFVEFLLSPKAQRLLMLKAGTRDGPEKFTLARYPILPSAYTTDISGRLINNNPYRLNLDLDYHNEIATTRWQLLNDLFSVSLIERWHQRKESSQIKPTFLVTESQIPFALSWMSDKNLRSQTLNNWRAQLDMQFPISIGLFSYLPTLLAFSWLVLVVARLRFRERASKLPGSSCYR